MDKSLIFFKIFFLSLFLCSSMEAVGEPHAFTVEARAAAFFPSSHRFRDIYGNVSTSYQVEVSGSLDQCWCGFEGSGLEVWANFDWFSRDKKKHCYKTRISILDGSFGLKYRYPLICDKLDIYLGLGACVGWLDLHNRTCFMHEKISKSPWGGVFKSGINYFICERIFVDLFVDYFYQPVHFHDHGHHHENIGGLKCGVGLGLGF